MNFKINSTPIYILTIFTSAFLLFQVQPLIGKYILPWFGGSPAVWTTCMLFFQVTLVAGYAYAHILSTRLALRWQAGVHIGLLLCALLFLPIIPADAWKPEAGSNPTMQILLLLTVSLGVPFFALSTTGPLLQRWFSMTHPERSPYRLYVWSNIGSFLALGSYPFLLEPNLSRFAQSSLWSLGLVFFAIICGYCAFRLYQQSSSLSGQSPVTETADTTPAPTVGRYLLWLALPATATLLLLAVTNTLSQDIAVLPFMWIVPLGLYLLSFILCFNNPRGYSRPGYGLALLAGLAWIAWLLFPGHGVSLICRSVTYLAVFFICCMVCHGEVVRLKPGPRHLTAFYLMLAVGGALGGIFVAVVAPLVFDSYYELQVGLLATLGLAVTVYFTDAGSRLYRGRPYWASSMVVLLTLGLAVSLIGAPLLQKPAQLSSSRNFYGTLTVREQHNYFPMRHAYTLRHGTTIHGLQFVNETLSRKPTGYYGERSGIGIALRAFPRQANRRIGLIGLGIGTLSAYAQDGDYLRYYEIDPAVKAIAENQFTYLAQSPAHTDIVLGDARLSLEREQPQAFDLLVLDAFNSDAIPVHLLTREAFTTYLQHLRTDGVLAVHITNRHLDLKPVLLAVAADLGLGSAVIRHSVGRGERGQFNSTWVLLTRDEEFLGQPGITASRSGEELNQPAFRMWTDEYASLFRVLK